MTRAASKTTPDTEATAGTITTKQMREMHALLRDHGITGDASIHDYIATWLLEQGEEPVESRKELTTIVAARLIDALHSEVPARYAPTVVQALSAVMADVRAVGKDSQAPGNIGGYQFRGVDAVVNAVGPALRRHGVVVMPEVLDVQRATTTTKAGGSMLNVYVRTQFTFHGPAGDSMSCVVLGEAADAGDKASSKAQSVALRVALLQALTLPTDEPDPDSQGYERAGAEAHHVAEAPAYSGPTTEELLASIDSYAQRMGVDYAEVTLPWRTAKGTAVNPDGTPVTLEQMEGAPPQYVAELEAAVAAQYETWKAAQPASTP